MIRGVIDRGGRRYKKKRKRKAGEGRCGKELRVKRRWNDDVAADSLRHDFKGGSGNGPFFYTD